MTSRSAIQNPRERKTDRLPRWAARALAFWQTWGLLLTGLWLIAVSIGILVVAVAFVKSQDRVAEQAKQACVRTKRLGPYIIQDYERRDALPPRVLAEYKSLIPTSCGR